MKTTKIEALIALALQYAKDNVRYNELLSVLRNSEGVNNQQLNFLNKTGFSKTNLATVEYELKKLHKISDSEVRNFEAAPEPATETKQVLVLLGDDKITEAEKQVRQEIRTVIENADFETKTEIKFRDEFPFLMDEDCPVELKALVTDKFGHYHKLCEAHAELFIQVVAPYLEAKKEYETKEQITDDVIFGLAKTALESFQADQSIYDELLHYKETKTILGKHESLAHLLPKENPLAKLTAVQLAKKKSNLENYIRRENFAADKAKKEADKKKYSAKADNFKLELELVEKELNERK